ncbi:MULTISPECIES: sulfotransferase family 2 domain-containing protein [Cobetia]|uniref:sulfotransferase family 2 domain-containing protein n=1 Tax=Cobetia TaxID=204286 RepID=UPI00098619A4|nr:MULTISPECIES: sulfotransferase family 2 domain-containing protein [Cobetia]POR06994.1 hypothetical protein BOH68_05045 [Cobetia sp. MM1IDA2H-1]
MIISDRMKFVFFHNPKCGGTSFRRHLKDWDDRFNSYWLFGDHYGVKVDKAHMPLYIFQCYHPVDYNKALSYTSFMFCRNPYTRFISAFNEIHKSFYKEYSESKVSLEEYSAKVNDFASNMDAVCVLGRKIHYRHFTKQVLYANNQGKNIVDVVIKLEDMQPGLEKIKILNEDLYKLVSSDVKMQNTKPMPSAGKYLDILNSETLRIINSLYEDDFKFFEYEMVK